MPTNPISYTVSHSQFINQLYPQGWGFFSKDPRDSTPNVYNMDTKKEAAIWPNNRLRNLFGASRYGRAQGTELGFIMSKIPNSKWEKCDEGSLTCLSKKKPQITVKNTTPKTTLCGDLGIAQEKPVPWAFGDAIKEIEMPSKVVRVKVKCLKG